MAEHPRDERPRRYGQCPGDGAECGEEIEQELWSGGAWIPDLCPKCSRIRQKREEREQVAEFLRKNREEVLNARLNNCGVKPGYITGRLGFDTYDPTKRNNRPAKQLELERKAMVACKEWALGIHPMNDQSEDMKGLYLHGGTGLGKSHYAQAALVAAIKRGNTGEMITFGDLVDDVREAMFSEDDRIGKREFLRRYGQMDCLVIDDIGGAGEKASDFTLGIAYTLINGRMRHGKRTIITANYDLTGLRVRLLPKDSHPVEVERILDRILEYCQIFKFEGESYR